MKDDCKRAEELLGRFHDGELDEAEARWMAEHIGSCQECRRKLTEFEAIDRLVRDEDTHPAMAEEYWDWHRRQVWKRIRQGRRRRFEGARKQRFMWLRAATVAAGAAVVILAVVGGWRLLRGPERQPIEVAHVDKLSPEMVEEAEEVPRTSMAKARRSVEAETERTSPKDETEPPSIPDAGYALRRGKAAGEAVGGAEQSGTVATGRKEGDGVERAEEAVADVDRDGEIVGGAGRAMAKAVPATRSQDVLETLTSEPAAAGVESAVLAAEGQPPVCDLEPELLDIGLLPTVEPDETATVFLRALVEADGSVSEVEIEQSSGLELLDSVAAGNVRQARFRPGYFQDEPARCWVRLTQQFEADSVPPAETDSTSETSE